MSAVSSLPHLLNTSACHFPLTKVGPQVSSRYSRTFRKWTGHWKIATTDFTTNPSIGWDSFTFFVAPQHPHEGCNRLRRPFGRIRYSLPPSFSCRSQRRQMGQQPRSSSWSRWTASSSLQRHAQRLPASPPLWFKLACTSVRFYCGDVASKVTAPQYQACPHQDSVVPPGFLEVEWDLDIRSQDGFDQMKEIVADITAATAAL